MHMNFTDNRFQAVEIHNAVKWDFYTPLFWISIESIEALTCIIHAFGVVSTQIGVIFVGAQAFIP